MVERDSASSVATGRPATRRRMLAGAGGLLAGAGIASLMEPVDALAAGSATYDVVADHGAAGDGTADDTAEIQAAINAASVTGGTVFFPPGTYRVSAKLTVSADNVVLAGTGLASRIVLAPNSNSNALRVNTGSGRLRGFGMRDLYFDHQGSQQANQGSGIEGALVVWSVDHVRIDNVYVKNARNAGFDLRGGTNVRVRGCTADTIVWGGAANGFNLGGTLTVDSEDYVAEGCEVIAGPDGDVGIWFGGVGASNFVAHGCIVRGGASGIYMEGAGTETQSNPSTHLAVVGCVVEGQDNVGIGFGDATTSPGSKGEHGVIADNVVRGGGAGSTAILVLGSHRVIEGNVIDGFPTYGIRLGGTDYDECDFVIAGNVVTARSDTTGAAIDISKSGTFSNALHDVTLTGNVLNGNSGGGNGIRCVGKVKNVTVVGNDLRDWKQAGIRLGATGGAAPSQLQLSSNSIRNSNRSGGGRGVGSVGISFDGGVDSAIVQANRVTDDQATKTQTDALYVGGGTKLYVRDNDFRGNSVAAFQGTLEANSVYEGNIEVGDAYEGTATLSPTGVTVSTAAIKSDSIVELTHRTVSGTPGALYLDTKTAGTSFRIRSTSATDTSTVRWRIR